MSNGRIKLKHAVVRQYRWYTHWPMWLLFGGPALLVAFILVQVYRADGPQKSDTSVAALAVGQDLHLDPAKLKPSQLNLFEGGVSGQKVRFVVQRTPDNEVHVALASCRACYRSKNPHYAQKGELMCGKCNMPMRFESSKGVPSDSRCTLPEIKYREAPHDIAVMIRDVLAEAAKIPAKK